MSQGKPIPAIVVGAGLNGLGIIRSLSLAGVQCHLIDCNSSDPTLRTRLARLHTVDNLNDATLIDALVSLASEIGTRPALFLTQEDSVQIVSQYRDRLDAHYRFRLPPREVVDSLTSKAGFLEASLKHNAPIPRTQILHSKADLSKAQTFRFPAIIKPNRHDRDYVRRFRKAYKLSSFAELTALYDELAAFDIPFVIQEFISGRDSDIHFCLQYRVDAGAVTSFCGRKLQSHPPETGGTAVCTIADRKHWDELTSATEIFFSKTQVTGLCSMEFKQDSRDGRFVMIEPTIGRSDYQEEVATLNGYNIAFAAYCDLTDKALPGNPTFEERHVWIDSDALAHYDSEWRDLTNRNDRLHRALFNRRDPMPWLYRQWLRAARKLSSAHS